MIMFVFTVAGAAIGAMSLIMTLRSRSERGWMSDNLGDPLTELDRLIRDQPRR